MSDITTQPHGATPDGITRQPATPGVGALASASAARPGERRLRLWPGLVLGVLLLLALAPSRIDPTSLMTFMFRFWGPMIVGLGMIVWWLFASRLSWGDRLLGVAAFILAGVGAAFLAHPSMAFGLLVYALPAVLGAWVGWLLLSAFLPWGATRRMGLVAVLLLTWGFFTLLRFDGTTGAMSAALNWRWTPTPEELLLAELGEREEAGTGQVGLKLQPGDWPEFRGPNRDSRLAGVRIGTDWENAPPKLLWKQRIGPGWSSFAVVGKSLFTQEQRGPNEVVVCYDADTGRQRWASERAERFAEMVAGPGPRATPTFHEGKLYALGAKGHLDCLDAATGKRLWERDIKEASGAPVPTWGFSASPLVTGGLVIVYAGADDKGGVTGDKGVVAYKADSGKLAWASGKRSHSYCSMQLSKLGGVEQLLVAHGEGVLAVEPTRGKVLWEHEWKGPKGLARVTQPAVLDDRDVLIGTFFGLGTRRLRLTRQGSTWQDEEVWTTRAIKPYFNDLVVHNGHLYGFDAMFFVCVDLEEGREKWRARGYGNGQVLLLADQGLLLVLTEKGEVALVEASPAQHVRVGKVKGLEGKTWNHPVIAHGRLYIRNGEEMACFALPR